MIVLDTNILSELLRPRMDVGVAAWIDAQPPASLFTTAITQGELLYGIAILPAGQRRFDLQDAVTLFFRKTLAAAYYFSTQLLLHIMRQLRRIVAQLAGL